jgi:uncharacterized protein
MTGNLESDLRDETLKWLKKAEDLRTRVRSEEDERFLENISAYISDSHYFLDRGDPIRAFEAVIWAWAWMEIGQETGKLVIEDGSLDNCSEKR